MIAVKVFANGVPLDPDILDTIVLLACDGSVLNPMVAQIGFADVP